MHGDTYIPEQGKLHPENILHHQLMNVKKSQSE